MRKPSQGNSPDRLWSWFDLVLMALALVWLVLIGQRFGVACLKALEDVYECQPW